MTSRNLLRLVTPTGGDPVENAAMAAMIVAAVAFDHVVGERLAVTIGFATVVALLLRRPTDVIPLLGVAFVATTATSFLRGSGAASLVDGALDTAVAYAVLVGARLVGGTGRRIRTARMLVEVLFVVALAAPLAGAGVATILMGTPLGGFIHLERLADWPSRVLGAVTVAPVLLIGGRDDIEETLRRSEMARAAATAMITGATAWLAFKAFPFPFVVACVPLLFAAAHLRPAVVALLGSACTVEMTMIGRFAHTARPEVADGSIVVAAALTGVLPIALALLLDELKGERHLLARTGEHLRRVLAGVAGHGFCSLDRDGVVVGWNDKIAAVTGFAAEDIVGRSFAAFFGPGARANGLPDALLEHAATHGRTESIGWRIRGDGRSYWASTVVEATRNGKGEIVGFTQTVQDQSELQRSESALLAAERRIGFALGSSGQGIWEIDPVAGRMHYSDVYAAMLGLPAAVLRDDPGAWKARVHPDDVAKIPPDDAGDEAGETELRLRHADGHWIWIADRRRVAERDEAGRPTRVFGSHTDITARKLAEEKFRLAVEASPNGLLIADADGRITLVNREIERMFGYADGTLLGHSIDDLVPEAHRGAHAGFRRAYAERADARRMGAGRDLNGRRADGTLFPVEIGLNPIATTEGTQILCVVTDITARKLAEEKFRLAVEASPHGVLIADRDGRLTLVNSETERMFGYAPGALLGRSIDILVPEEARGTHAMRRGGFVARPAARRMGAGRDLSGRRADGSLFPVEIGLNPIVTAEGESILCVVTDITARKQTEAELAVSEARYRMMADHFIDLVVHLDLNLERTWVSPAARDILGVEPETLLGCTPSGLVHPDDRETVQARLRAVAEGADRVGYCVRYRHAAGYWIWLDVSLRLIRGTDGAPVGILAVGRDVSRERAAEEALKASEATFRGAMESASIGMVLEEIDGRWVSVNHALCEILGTTEADLLERGRSAVVHPDDADADADLRRRLLAGEIASFQIEQGWLNRPGGVVWTHQSISTDRAPDGSVRRLILQIQDVTERRLVELMKSEFVSMVSHELRTPLTSIRGALGLVLGTMKDTLPPRAVHLVDIAHKNSERLIPLVNDILDLDKIDAGMMRVDLGEVDAVDLVRQAIEATRAFCDRYGVRVVARMPERAATVRVDEGRFVQVVTNLLSNAAKFSPTDGVVEIETSVADGRVRVAVRDHGPGISDEFRAKIFGRFAQADSATTRAKGGSGLGLHICRQLVTLMGGTIDFTSTVGDGSTFWIDFPLAGGAATVVDIPNRASTESHLPERRRITFLAEAGAATEFLRTAIAEAGAEASEVFSAETIAVVVDVAARDTPAAAMLQARLDASADRPPVVLVEAGAEQVGAAAALAQAWRPRDVWTVDPANPQAFVARIAELIDPDAAGLPRLLHVEDDHDLAAVVAAGLAGLVAVTCVARISQARRELQLRRYDLVLIDPVLPDGDGIGSLVPGLVRSGIPYMVLSADEHADVASTAVANLVKSRIDERRLVATIRSTLADKRLDSEGERHVV